MRKFNTVATYKTNMEQKGSHMADNPEATLFVIATKIKQYLGSNGAKNVPDLFYRTQNTF